MEVATQIIGGVAYTRFPTAPLVEENPLAKTQTTTICPCCKSAISVKIPIVDLNTNTVSWRGKSTKLAHSKIDLLSLLVRRFPGMVSHEQIIIHLWGDDEPDYADNVVKVHVCQLRKQVEHMGIGVQNIWGSGYQLVLGDAS